MRDVADTIIKVGDFCEVIGLLGLFRITHIGTGGYYIRKPTKGEKIVFCKMHKNPKGVRTGYGLPLAGVWTTNYWIKRKPTRKYKEGRGGGMVFSWPFGRDEEYAALREKQASMRTAV